MGTAQQRSFPNHWAAFADLVPLMAGPLRPLSKQRPSAAPAHALGLNVDPNRPAARPCRRQSRDTTEQEIACLAPSPSSNGLLSPEPRAQGLRRLATADFVIEPCSITRATGAHPPSPAKIVAWTPTSIPEPKCAGELLDQCSPVASMARLLLPGSGSGVCPAVCEYTRSVGCGSPLGKLPSSTNSKGISTEAGSGLCVKHEAY